MRARRSIGAIHAQDWRAQARFRSGGDVSDL